MVLEPKIQRIYREIQKKLFYMSPEKWRKVYLYSSILERQNHLETGELFFYYIPKGVLKKNPVNVYEIPTKFSIDEEQYLKLVDNLYAQIRRLQQTCVELGEEKWNSVIISIADFKFNVEYNYDNLGFSSYEKHLIFRYKYLEYSLESFNKNERDIINQYLYYTKYHKIRVKKYTEPMYEMPFEIIEAGTKNGSIQYVKDDDVRLIEEKKEIKSQILKSGF